MNILIIKIKKIKSYQVRNDFTNYYFNKYKFQTEEEMKIYKSIKIDTIIEIMKTLGYELTKIKGVYHF